jgi:hypothetical protein
MSSPAAARFVVAGAFPTAIIDPTVRTNGNKKAKLAPGEADWPLVLSPASLATDYDDLQGFWKGNLIMASCAG